MSQHNFDATPNLADVPKGAMQTEPAGMVATITGAVTAVIALLVAYGFDISNEQQVALLGVVAVIAPVIAGIVTRSKVASPASAIEAVNEAAVTGDAVGANPMKPKAK